MPLRDYQVVGVNHLQRNPHAGLFLDMGLGKTAIVLSALTPDHLPALVFAPKLVCEEVWPEEVAKWRPDLSIIHIVGSPAQRKKLLATPADIHVMSRELPRDVPQFNKYRTIVLDESSGYKSRGMRWKGVWRLIKEGMPHVWELTGTPSPNGLRDLWAQLYLLDEGKRLGRRRDDFDNEHFRAVHRLPNGVVTRWEIREGHDKKIHSLIDDICLSMTTEGRVKLPEFTINPVSVPLPPKVRRIYDDLRRDLIVNLDIIGGEVHTAANAAVLGGKLAQITSGFLFVDDQDIRDGQWQDLHDEKIDAAKMLVELTDSPMLIAYNFIPEKEKLLRAFPKAEVAGKTPGLSKRWNDGEIPVLLAHPKSAGHGLNLQYGGHTGIWASTPWSLEYWDQLNKRLHRSGQVNPVVMHVLESPGTVDGKIREALQGKTTVQRALMNHLESPI